MVPEPKMSPAKPYRWVGCIVLHPQDVKELLQALPKGSHLRARLQDAANEAAAIAGHLNEVEQGRAA